MRRISRRRGGLSAAALAMAAILAWLAAAPAGTAHAAGSSWVDALLQFIGGGDSEDATAREEESGTNDASDQPGWTQYLSQFGGAGEADGGQASQGQPDNGANPPGWAQYLSQFGGAGGEGDTAALPEGGAQEEADGSENVPGWAQYLSQFGGANDADDNAAAPAQPEDDDANQPGWAQYLSQFGGTGGEGDTASSPDDGAANQPGWAQYLSESSGSQPEDNEDDRVYGWGDYLADVAGQQPDEPQETPRPTSAPEASGAPEPTAKPTEAPAGDAAGWGQFLSGAGGNGELPESDHDTWAVYVYLCGTDLETEGGAASLDLEEIMTQRLPEGVTFVIETGGARRWASSIVNPKVLQRFVMRGNRIACVAEEPLASMGDADTLADFLRFCHENYPADHEAVIFWDHGGGSAEGLVLDELFRYDNLTLSEMRQAFNQVFTSDADDPPLELVGFDCCLMATVDTAGALAGIARYMVASEETEPGYGWNYRGMIRAMQADPEIGGEALGIAICDAYMSDCERYGVADEATLSLVDMALLDGLLEAYDAFGAAAVLAACDDPGFFAEFGRGARGAENYGGNTFSSGFTNMVDLGDLAAQTMDLLPDAARAVIAALGECVIYKVNGEYRSKASGLSCYYAYDGDEDTYEQYAEASVSENFTIYYDYMLSGTLDEDAQAHLVEDLGYDPDSLHQETVTVGLEPGASYPVSIDSDGYAVIELGRDTLASVSEIGFQLAYFNDDEDILLYLGTDNDIEADWETGVFRDNFRGTWGAIDGCLCHMEIIYQSAEYNYYNIPILLNGEEYQLKVVYDFTQQEYRILGAQRGLNDYGMADREMVQLEPGDVVTTIHYAASFSGDDALQAVEVDSVTVGEDTAFGEVDLGDGMFLMVFTLTDAVGQTAYSDPVIFRVKGDDISAWLP